MKPLFKSLFLIFAVLVAPIFAGEKVGVILMHGKWGTSLPKSPIGKLSSFLEDRGFIVIKNEMPWSRNRSLDKSYEDSLKEINTLVQRLKSKGITKVVVGGHSLGANAALGYAARYEGLSGVLAIAPGHVPELKGFQNKMENDWKKAKRMLNDGKGKIVAKFFDINQGKKSKKSIKAGIYYSWYNPSGLAVIPTNVANIKANTPLLWIIGEKDLMNKRGMDYAYNGAPQHSKNKYIVVKGGHGATPMKGKSEILKWLKKL